MNNEFPISFHPSQMPTDLADNSSGRRMSGYVSLCYRAGASEPRQYSRLPGKNACIFVFLQNIDFSAAKSLTSSCSRIVHGLTSSVSTSLHAIFRRHIALNLLMCGVLLSMYCLNTWPKLYCAWIMQPTLLI